MAQGQTLAFLNAAYLYGEGDGVAVNGVKAAELFMSALTGGEQGALDELNEPSIEWPKDFYTSLQKRLKRAGFYSGAITGRFGPESMEAARAAFDSDNGEDGASAE